VKVVVGFAKRAGITIFTLALSAISHGQVTNHFDTSSDLDNNFIGGDKSHFEITSAQAQSGPGSIRFADSIVEPYESWTYDIPFDLTSGTITTWFYDARGSTALTPHGSPQPARWGGAIIIEDKSNPADFGAVEISEMPYGPKYYATEGSVNRGFTGSDKFDSNSLAMRSVGFHKVEFHISANESKIYIDGLLADEVSGPGSTGNNLRLRFMYDSPSNAGSSSGNWITAPSTESRGRVDADGNVPDWIFYDDVTIAAELPSVQSHNLNFEITGETPDFDTAGSAAPLIPPFDNPNMNDFVNQWAAVTSSTAHSGTTAAQFKNVTAPFKSLSFDLSNLTPGTSVTLWFYDSNGNIGSYENVRGNSIIIEEGANAGNFHAVEISTFPFPHGGDKTYYLTVGSSNNGGETTLYSKGLGLRSVGWHEVEIGVYATHSQIAVDGKVAKYITSGQTEGAIAQGPGLDKQPRLRLLGDTAAIGRNYTNTNLIYENSYATRDHFVFFDEVTIRLSNAGVSNWMNY